MPSVLTLRRLVLVRHGETVGESSVRYHGRNDVALSDSGRRQMQRVAGALAGEEIDAVYSSTLARSVASARIIAPGLEPRRLAGFDEIHFGRWEGLTREEIEACDPELFRRWRTANGEFTFPEGDSVRQFRARVLATWGELASQAPARTLVVAHRGVIAAILSDTLGLAPEDLRSWRMDLGSLHVLVRDGERWRADIADAHAHLEA